MLIKVEPKPKLSFQEDCEDNPKLAKCHLIVASKLCNKSEDLARYDKPNYLNRLDYIHILEYVAGVVWNRDKYSFNENNLHYIPLYYQKYTYVTQVMMILH